MYILGRCEVAVVAYGPRLAARQAQARDVPQHGRAQQELARPGKGRVAHLAAGHKPLDAELVRALEYDGRGHGDHGALFTVSALLGQGERTSDVALHLAMWRCATKARRHSPGLACRGQLIASCTVRMVLQSRWLMR